MLQQGQLLALGRVGQGLLLQLQAQGLVLEELADAMEESVNSFQNEIRPLGEVRQELLSLPAIASRLNSI